MSQARVFDAKSYETLNRSRAAVVSDLLSNVKEQLKLQTAVDVGCGLGYFSGFLQSQGFEVIGVDGRQENAAEAQRRFPGVRFHHLSAEDSALVQLGQFDLVFCFGLLYHLENPLLAIRHLWGMTRSLLLVESVIFPGQEPIMTLVDEGQTDDQGLNHFAFYPTEVCLEKMFYRAGFRSVYRFRRMPDHPDYRETKESRRVRTMLAASNQPVETNMLMPVVEPSTVIKPWDGRRGAGNEKPFEKLRRFAGKPLPEKMESIKRLVRGSGE